MNNALGLNLVSEVRRLREALAPLAGAVELYRPGRHRGDPRIYTVEEEAVLNAKALLEEEVKP